MAGFSDRELKVLEIAGGVFAAAGLLAALLTLIPHDPTSFWDELIRGVRGGALVVMGCGVVWGVMAALHRRTSFFTVDTPIDGQDFGISIVSVAFLAVMVLLLVLYNLPSTPLDKLPPDAAMAARILKQQKALRGIVALSVLCTAAVFASFPCRRFFRQ